MAVIKKMLKSGGYSWLVLMRDQQGNWFPSKSFKDKKEATIYEAELIQKKSKGTLAASNADKEMTLSRYFYEVWHKEARTGVTQGWKEREEWMFERYVEPYLGKMLVVEIQKKDITKLMSILSIDKGLAPGSIKHVHKMLRQVFNYSIEISEIRESNPVLSKFAPKIPKYMPKYFTPDMAREFLSAVRDRWIGPAVWIMAATGIRKGELVGLQMGDLDFENRQIILRRQYRNSEEDIVRVLKNGKPEYHVPMPEELAQYLKEKLRASSRSTDWVIHRYGYPDKMASYHSVTSSVKYICRKLGFPVVTPHGLRHTTSGLWSETGAQRSDLRQVYNHDDESITKRYDHSVPDRLKELSKQVKLSVQKTVH